MPTFTIHLMGQNQPITIDLPCTDVDALIEHAGHSRFLSGHMTEPDGEGVCRRVIVATSRIQCVVEAD